jgi:hypothetical protein
MLPRLLLPLLLLLLPRQPDHFLGIKSAYPVLFKCDSFVVEPATSGREPGQLDVDVRLMSGGDESAFVFRMERRELGSKKGCWLTKKLLPKGSKFLS